MQTRNASCLSGVSMSLPASLAASIASIRFRKRQGRFRSWGAALSFIAQQAKDEHIGLVFDEFPYAAKRNAGLISSF